MFIKLLIMFIEVGLMNLISKQISCPWRGYLEGWLGIENERLNFLIML